MKKRVTLLFLSLVILIGGSGCTIRSETEGVEESTEEPTSTPYCLFRLNLK